MDIKTQRWVSLGLSVLNTVGVIGTFIFVSKETPKAKKELDNLPKNCKKITKVKTFAKNYKKSLIFATATIASGIGSRVVSYKTEASLIATIGVLDASLHKYKNKVKDILGVDADKEIVKEIIKDNNDKPDESPQTGEVLYSEEHIGYFYAKPENINKAMLILNEDVSGNSNYFATGRDASGIFTIGEFLKACEGRPLSHNLDENRLNFGWSFDYLSKFHDIPWVHLDISEPDNEGVRMLYWFEDPVWNPTEWCDYYFGKMPADKYFEGYKGKLSETNKQYYVK